MRFGPGGLLIRRLFYTGTFIAAALFLFFFAHGTDAQSLAGEDWVALWDGSGVVHWRSWNGENFPRRGWIQDGEFLVARGGGSIVTREIFGDFVLDFEFRLNEGANSGVLYLLQPGERAGYEYQLLDNARHPDGRHPARSLAALYDISPALPAPVNPPGNWNHGRIVVTGPHIEHWLNGDRVLAIDRESADFLSRWRESKFRRNPDFPSHSRGQIMLQDHGDIVSFRNIRIKILNDT